MADSGYGRDLFLIITPVRSVGYVLLSAKIFLWKVASQKLIRQEINVELGCGATSHRSGIGKLD